ncbi:MAG: hypothetical protein AB2A00_12560 [Myxococcota bacterium]
MLTTLLSATLLLLPAGPLAGETARPAAHAATVAPGFSVGNGGALVLTEMDMRGIMKGLRNMAVGAAIFAVGGGFGLASVGALVVGALAYLLAANLFGAAVGLDVASPVMGGAWMSAIGLAMVSTALVVAGVLWFSINALLVLIRLNPDYKPSPGTEFLEP